MTLEVALRAGSVENKYRTADGRFILDTRALRSIRLTSDEYVTGIQGVEVLTPQEADEMIAAGGYKMGLPEETVSEAETVVEEPETEEQPEEAPAEEQPDNEEAAEETETNEEKEGE